MSDPLLPDIDKRLDEIMLSRIFVLFHSTDNIPEAQKAKQDIKSEIIRMLEQLREQKQNLYHVPEDTLELGEDKFEDIEAIPLTALDDLIGRLK